jgi:hypothetical protein
MDALQPPNLRGLSDWLQEAIDAELKPDERVLWVGQPKGTRSRLVHTLLVVNILLGVVLAIHLIPPPWFDLWATFFGGFPAFMRYVVLASLVGQMTFLGIAGFRLQRARARTWYALTDRRIIVTEPQPLMRLAIHSRLLDLWSYGPNQLGAMECEAEEDGSGDLTLEEYQAKDTEGDAYTGYRGIMNIPDVRRVERLVRDTLISTG